MKFSFCILHISKTCPFAFYGLLIIDYCNFDFVIIKNLRKYRLPCETLCTQIQYSYTKHYKPNLKSIENLQRTLHLTIFNVCQFLPLYKDIYISSLINIFSYIGWAPAIPNFESYPYKLIWRKYLLCEL